MYVIVIEKGECHSQHYFHWSGFNYINWVKKYINTFILSTGENIC